MLVSGGNNILSQIKGNIIVLIHSSIVNGIPLLCHTHTILLYRSNMFFFPVLLAIIPSFFLVVCGFYLFLGYLGLVFFYNQTWAEFCDSLTGHLSINTLDTKSAF